MKKGFTQTVTLEGETILMPFSYHHGEGCALICSDLGISEISDREGTTKIPGVKIELIAQQEELGTVLPPDIAERLGKWLLRTSAVKEKKGR